MVAGALAVAVMPPSRCSGRATSGSPESGRITREPPGERRMGGWRSPLCVAHHGRRDPRAPSRRRATIWRVAFGVDRAPPRLTPHAREVHRCARRFRSPGAPLSRLLLSTAASFLIGPGCTPDTESATLEVYSWWDSSGEKAAFNALVGPFERSRPDIDVRNGYRRDSQEVRGDLGALMLQGVPPNTFQANAGADLLQWAAVDFAPAADGPFDGSLPSPQDSWNLLTDVSGLLGREALDALYPEVRRQVCVEASNAEHHLAVPVNIHRLNLLYYNTDRVADAERRFAMDSLCPENAAELAPSERPAFDLAISVGDGLSLTLLTFENLLLVVGKETAYRALLEGGDPSLWRAPMQRALGCLWYLSGAFI